MKPAIVIIICLVIFVGSTYAALRALRSQPTAELPSETEADANSGFYASREGVGSQTTELAPVPSQSQSPEDFIVIARSGNDSSTVVLVQPKQPSNSQPALSQTDPSVVKKQIDAVFNLEVSGSSATTASSPSLTIGRGVIVVSNHALYSWNDENSGGESLFSIDASGTWKLMSMGGGVWSVDGLIDFGVPRATAEQLVAKKPWGQR